MFEYPDRPLTDAQKQAWRDAYDEFDDPELWPAFLAWHKDVLRIESYPTAVSDFMTYYLGQYVDAEAILIDLYEALRLNAPPGEPKSYTAQLAVDAVDSYFAVELRNGKMAFFERPWSEDFLDFIEEFFAS